MLKKEINLNKKVIIYLLIINIISLTSYYSYAMFQVNVLKSNAIILRTATNMNITTTVDNTNSDTFTLNGNQTKNVVVNLDTDGITSAMAYKMYYELTGTGSFTVTSTENFPDDKIEGVMQPYLRSNNIKITGKVFTLTFTNNSSNTLTIKLGAVSGFEAEGATLTDEEELVVNTVTVSFNPNGGTLSSLTKDLKINSTTYGDLPTPAKDGYNFLGWYTALEGGTKITSSTSFTYRTSVTTLYAHWETAIQYYTVTLDKNGGTGGTDSVQVAYGEPMPEATGPNTPRCVVDGMLKRCYNFCGYTANGDSYSAYYDSSMQSVRNYDLNTDTILYARWAESCAMHQGGGND